MEWELVEEPLGNLAKHGQIAIAFRVDRIFEVVPLADGLGGLALREASVGSPWIKDYDAGGTEGPASWPKRWDLTHWGLIAAHRHGVRVGGVVLAFDTVGLDRLGGRRDVVVVWDLRIHPDHRRRGIGRALFEAAINWAKLRGCRRLRVETQNINVPACRFYARQRCTLGAIDRFAYPEFPAEVQLVWSKDLTQG